MPVTTIINEPLINPHENDVLMGRGGKNNQHSGNEKLRQLAKLQSTNYRESTKKGKSKISRELVQCMRELHPPARFLKRDVEKGGWVDVGDDIAREKASQVLRDAVAVLEGNEQQQRADATSTSGNEVNDDRIESNNLSAPFYGTDTDRKPSASSCNQESHLTPGLVDHISSSSSFPPPSPIEGNRKRNRLLREDDSEPLLYDTEALESPTRRIRSDLFPECRESPTWQNKTLSSFQKTHHSGTFSCDDNHSYRLEARSTPLAAQVLSHSATPGLDHFSSPRGVNVEHPHLCKPSNRPPGTQNHQDQHPEVRPQSIAARQASTASYQSLLGDVNGGTGGDFDLFGGELIKVCAEDKTVI